MTQIKIGNKKNAPLENFKDNKPGIKRKGILSTLFIVLSLLLMSIGLLLHTQYSLSVNSVYKKLIAEKESTQCILSTDAEKFNCYPEDNASEEKCQARGCCWVPQSKSLGVPWCYYPKGYTGYQYINVTPSTSGIVAFMKKNIKSPYPEDVNLLRMDVEYQTTSRLRVKIFDPSKKRYEAIYPKLRTPSVTPGENVTYKVDIEKTLQGFVVRRTNGNIIFDTQGKGAFIFSDQFIQISAQFTGKIYGLGEHRSNLQLDTNWTKLTLFNRDIVPLENVNLYGSHPFYLNLEPDGTANGVFLHNSNIMDVILQPLPAVTFRPIGGILDFYFFTGPSPGNVIQQYLELIGHPVLPPYWSLGFHLCRYGYKNVNHMQTVLNRTLEAGIPVDTQWADIDYMKDNNDFTLNNMSFAQLPVFVKQLHHAGMHFVPILDPGVSASEPNGSYPPYDEGIQLDIFVKNQDGSLFVGKVWNRNSTVYPDFTNQKTFVYWTGLIHKLHDVIPFDGIWIDMNEPSNFLDGTKNGCPNGSLDNPPYRPGGRNENLAHKTICMSAQQAQGVHYNLHNLYGISEAHATYRALKEILQVRPFIISRSTFSGIGNYAGHWSGDVASTWHDMKRTISQMLSFSLYGVPMMGSDICGFNGNTTQPLCLRWSQLGAFYPFSRNHNTDNAIDQDPVALGAEVVKAAKNALTVRYTLLPYLYTLFWRAHTFGETVVRPIFFEFPEDVNTHGLDESFLWGCCLLVIPVLKEMETTVDTYLPVGRWYDWYTNMGSGSNGSNITLNAPTDTIVVLIRGGVVLPTQEPAANTVLSRTNKMSLIAAYNTNLTASGSFYWDDGESIRVKDSKEYGHVEFLLTAFNITSNVVHWHAKDIPVLTTLKILGFVRIVKQVTFNGTSTPFVWNSTSLVLTLENLNVSMNTPFFATWS